MYVDSSPSRPRKRRRIADATSSSSSSTSAHSSITDRGSDDLPPTMIKMQKGKDEKEVAKIISEETNARVKMMRKDLKLMQQEIVNKNLALPPTLNFNSKITASGNSTNYDSCIEASTSSSTKDLAASPSPTPTRSILSSTIKDAFTLPPPPAGGEPKKRKRGRQPKSDAAPAARSRSASSTRKDGTKLKQLELQPQNG